MDEILSKLLESELLSEETKKEISEQFTAFASQYKQSVREEVTLEVRAELSEQWVQERDALIDSVDTFVSEALQKELVELKSDIERFRDLEAEMAEKLVEEKHKLAEEVSSELDQLVDKIDAFFEMRLSEEMEELKEDLEIVKQNEFGRQIFEAFSTTYAQSYYDEDSSAAQLTVTESKLGDAQRRIAELEAAQAKMLREQKMEKVLSPLTGKKREQMAFVLQNVETQKLEEAYKFFIGRVLKEEDSSSSTAAVITEAAAPKAEATVLVTGEEQITEEVAAPASTQSSAALAQLKRLAGLK
jgi:hypothetical protein